MNERKGEEEEEEEEVSVVNEKNGRTRSRQLNNCESKEKWGVIR